ncbi:hypothetical protein FOA52_013460 [Chlamydomonas sp. UWO 241]|nr:hypothetical protein FOA52_013460 [Chlamydomonas sp. UWO 241]
MITGLVKHKALPDDYTPRGYPQPGSTPFNNPLVGNGSANAGNNDGSGTNLERFFTAEKQMPLGGGGGKYPKPEQFNAHAYIMHSLAFTRACGTVITANGAKIIVAGLNMGPGGDKKLLTLSTKEVMLDPIQLGIAVADTDDITDMFDLTDEPAPPAPPVPGDEPGDAKGMAVDPPNLP